MSTTTSRSPSAEQILSIVLEAGDPKDHRLHLSEMIVSWMHDQNRDTSTANNEQVYLTFVVLNRMLKAMEG